MGNPHFYGDYYVQMWTRFPPYLFGILLGWILYRTKNSKVNMNKVLSPISLLWPSRTVLNGIGIVIRC